MYVVTKLKSKLNQLVRNKKLLDHRRLLSNSAHVKPLRYNQSFLSSASAAAHQYGDTTSDNDKSIISAYEDRIRQDIIEEDDHQYKIVKSLQRLDDEISNYKPTEESLWTKLFNKNQTLEKPKGLYLWGSVGCGKTFLMDLFYENCSISDNNKKRVHFHRFMLDVHADIHQIKTGKKFKTSTSVQKNPIPLVAKLIAERSWLLCLDEFQVTDVADAMILKHLFTHLFQDGVILLATSNRQPDDLYKSGLQRSAFLPFIPMLKQECRVMCLDSNIDYRKRPSEIKKVYFVTTKEVEDTNIDSLFKVLSLAEHSIVGPMTFTVNNRQVYLNKTCGGIADCDFYELCEQPLGADDYDKMGKMFHTVIIRNIPQLNLKMKSELRRFITFIDMMYDNRVRVVFSARVPIEQLFKFEDRGSGDHHDHDTLSVLDDLNLKENEGKKLSFISGEDEVFSFDRTMSRIIEMQTNQYWESVSANQAIAPTNTITDRQQQQQQQEPKRNLETQ